GSASYETSREVGRESPVKPSQIISDNPIGSETRRDLLITAFSCISHRPPGYCPRSTPNATEVESSHDPALPSLCFASVNMCVSFRPAKAVSPSNHRGSRQNDRCRQESKGT